MIANAASPSSRSVTRPRTAAIVNGWSLSVIEIATRGSRSRLRALREVGSVRKTI
jgi:hypothetical protein